MLWRTGEHVHKSCLNKVLPTSQYQWRDPIKPWQRRTPSNPLGTLSLYALWGSQTEEKEGIQEVRKVTDCAKNICMSQKLIMSNEATQRHIGGLKQFLNF